MSATDDDDELDALVAERKTVKARIEGFRVVPDRFDYAPTGQTVAQMWNDGDDTVKRGIVQAVKESCGMILASHDGQWGIAIGTGNSKTPQDANGIVGWCSGADLGGKLPQSARRFPGRDVERVASHMPFGRAGVEREPAAR